MEAVQSALTQDYLRLEVLVSDDGNSNSIREWCLQQLRNDHRLRYRRNAHTLGLAANWNVLAREATGEYLVIIGDDDRLLPGFVSRLVAGAHDADVVFCNHYVIDSDGRRLEEFSYEYTRRYHRDELSAGKLDEAAVAVWRNAVPMSASLVRADVVRRLKFKEDLNTPEIELFARLAADSGRFVFVPDYLAEYRVHSGSATSSGLTVERLARYLEPLPVPPSIEEYKRELLEGMMPSAVSHALYQGDTELARRLLRSPYYGGDGGAKTLVMRCCASIPWVGPIAFRFMQRLRRRRAV